MDARMEVRYINHMGSDLEVVNAARVSFKKKSDSLSERDKRLIRFLARGCTEAEYANLVSDLRVTVENRVVDDQLLSIPEMDMWDVNDYIEEVLNYWRKTPTHWVPFANGGTVLLHIKAPIFVARQLTKHQAGFEPPSEVSRRYVDDPPEFYFPEDWRGRPKDGIKQGSGETVELDYDIEPYVMDGIRAYDKLLASGVAPEMARMVLPQNMYTEFLWKGNLYAWASLYNTRTTEHTQLETRFIAQQIGDIMKDLYPVSWEALTT